MNKVETVPPEVMEIASEPGYADYVKRKMAEASSPKAVTLYRDILFGCTQAALALSRRHFPELSIAEPVLKIDFNHNLSAPMVSSGTDILTSSGVAVFVGSWFCNDEEEPYPLMRFSLKGPKRNWVLSFLRLSQGIDTVKFYASDYVGNSVVDVDDVELGSRIGQRMMGFINRMLNGFTPGQTGYGWESYLAEMKKALLSVGG